MDRAAQESCDQPAGLLPVCFDTARGPQLGCEPERAFDQHRGRQSLKTTDAYVNLKNKQIPPSPHHPPMNTEPQTSYLLVF